MGYHHGNKFWENYLGEKGNLSSAMPVMEMKFSVILSEVFKENFIRSMNAFRDILHVVPHIATCLSQIKGSVGIVTCDHYVASGKLEL